MYMDFIERKEIGEGFVTLMEVQGDEDLITLAARQSYGSSEIKNKNNLIPYLLKHYHSVPFEYVRVIFKISAPIFVARHFYTYRTWTRSEKSLRYVTPGTAVFHYPTGTEDGERILEAYYHHCMETYQRLREEGYRKEDARVVLPMGLYTEFMVAIDLRNFGHFLRQRLEKSTQPLTREYARVMMELVKDDVPLWYATFKEMVDGID